MNSIALTLCFHLDDVKNEQETLRFINCEKDANNIENGRWNKHSNRFHTTKMIAHDTKNRQCSLDNLSNYKGTYSLRIGNEKN